MTAYIDGWLACYYGAQRLVISAMDYMRSPYDFLDSSINDSHPKRMLCCEFNSTLEQEITKNSAAHSLSKHSKSVRRVLKLPLIAASTRGPLPSNVMKQPHLDHSCNLKPPLLTSDLTRNQTNSHQGANQAPQRLHPFYLSASIPWDLKESNVVKVCV